MAFSRNRWSSRLMMPTVARTRLSSHLLARTAGYLTHPVPRIPSSLW